jgi:hypothetical protein
MMKDPDDRSFLSFHIGSDSADLDIIDLVIVKTLNIHLTTRLEDVVTCDTSVTALVDKRVLACQTISHLSANISIGIVPWNQRDV